MLFERGEVASLEEHLGGEDIADGSLGGEPEAGEGVAYDGVETIAGDAGGGDTGNLKLGGNTADRC